MKPDRLKHQTTTVRAGDFYFSKALARMMNRRGLSFLLLIFSMTLLVGLGAAIYTITTSSLYTELNESSRNQAYQLALAGLNFAGEQKKNGILANLDNQTFTLADNRSQFHLSVATVGGDDQVTSTGIVNSADGNLLARVQLVKGFSSEPSTNELILKETFQTGNTGELNAFDPSSLRNLSGQTVIRIGEYVATGGQHMYWAAFTSLGQIGYRFRDPEQIACYIGYHVGVLGEDTANRLRQSWNRYHHVNYDVQIKAGWYKDLPAAITGISFRWHESTTLSKFQGYALSFMRFTSQGWCGDYIPNSIKPNKNAAGATVDLRNKLLLVLWEQYVEGGIEKKRWLAYAVLGQPQPYPQGPHYSSNDPKVCGAQDDVDGLLNDDASLVVRIKDKIVGGQRLNEILAFYGDASPYYSHTRNGVCTDIARGRYAPEWVEPNLFPTWPSNNIEVFTDLMTLSYWNGRLDRYDYFTLASADPKVPPNPVVFIKNPTINDPNIIELLADKATIRTRRFPLTSFPAQRGEIGLHAMGNLNDSDRVVAFDDWAIQILGSNEQ
jgi:hypothetical protein